MDPERRDGFLFVGNRLSLDFLNTRPVIDGVPTELLGDCPALARWLAAAGLISGREAKQREKCWVQPAYAAALGQLQDFREKLRQVVLAYEAAAQPSRSFMAELNRLLEEYPNRSEVVPADAGLIRARRFEPRTPLDTFAPLADSVADLLTIDDPARIRKCSCPQCVLHFYDVSKIGTRRWCSMDLCGNRAKVAAYMQRKKEEQS